jgi:hypothetical protein
MDMLLFLIAVFTFIGLIASGIVLNMYLHTQGVFKLRRLHTIAMSQGAIAEDLFPMSLGIPIRK